MKITIINSSNAEEQPLVINLDQNATLRDLIMSIDKARAAAKLQPIYQYSHQDTPLLSANLDTPLRGLLATEGEMVLHASLEVPKDAQQNLSPEVLVKHAASRTKNDPAKQPPSALLPTKPRSYIADQKRILGTTLFFFPQPLVDLVSDYRGDKEAELSNYDSYLVVDVAEILNCGHLPRRISGRKDHFYFALAEFLSMLELGRHPDGQVVIAMDPTKFKHCRFIDPEHGAPQEYFAELKLAMASIHHPSLTGSYHGFIDDYEMVIQLSPENNVRCIYAYTYDRGDFNNLIDIDCSNLVISNSLNAQIRGVHDLNASIIQFLLEKIFGKNYPYATYPDEGIPVAVTEYHPYEKRAMDYFLKNSKAGEAKWDLSNPLDEVITHALLSQNSIWRYAKGSQTKRNILTLLGQDETWFNLQTHASLKNAILSHVQLHYAAKEATNQKTHQPLPASRPFS
ncbi:MAG TPA: hypothetical protein VLI69_04750 [Gammaproteobacteria bacterium]|nr:hypothetical protein [Gammaproteobacteria bacterium]